METMSLSSSSLSAHHQASTFDELSMQQSLLFMDSLKDLRNLRSQLYSAAEYFESSYTNDDQKEIVVNTLKDYAVKALVNTVDHLGSVSYKVNGLLDEKVDEVAGTELRVSCIEQRLRTCQEYIDREGLSQQSLVITAPKYHKRYVLPGTASPKSGTLSAAKYQESTIDKEDGESRGLQTAVRSTIRARLPPSGKLHSLSPSQRGRSSSPSPKVRSQSPCTRPGKFSTKDKRAISPLPTSNPLVRVSATDKRAVLPFPASNPLVRVSATDKRSVSPLRSSSPFARSGSLSSRSNVLNSSGIRHRYPTEPQKSASLRLHAERNDNRELEHSSSKSRSFLKSLLTRRRSRKDEMLYSYLDEY